MIPSMSVSVSPAASHISVSSGISSSAASTSDVDLGIEHLLSGMPITFWGQGDNSQPSTVPREPKRNNYNQFLLSLDHA